MLGIIGLLLGIVRVLVGVHEPKDIAAGALAGSCAELLAIM